jgi:hypothetical protein
MTHALTPVLLLVVSNVFMTYAWYGHLRDFASRPLWMVVLLAWGVAFFEYCFQVPANRLGYRHYTAIELKTIQEIVSLSVFLLFSVVYLRETVRWNHLLGFALMVLAVWVVFKKW